MSGNTPVATKNPFSRINISRCRFNVAGVDSVRGHLATDGALAAHDAKLDAAAMAFVLSGSHRDGRHATPHNQFHEDFRVFRANLATGKAGYDIRKSFRDRASDLLFDTATAFDRINGGATLVIQVNGAMQPGALRVPEHVKTNVYFPPSLLEEVPEFGIALARINQIFVEDIALRVISRWETAFRKAGYSYDFKKVDTLPTVDHPLLPSFEGLPRALRFMVTHPRILA
ncbi:hypothetical protein A0H81_14852 [Grifola frondosa]|uniref:Uncharacterized protein n=1 Tax=Grifola frondosa TaxID=5627 RepID=A0A1C7LKM0_GRIFR|nr:hypothetical protein A0H81_14852 [Grifola frondosa]